MEFLPTSPSLAVNDELSSLHENPLEMLAEKLATEYKLSQHENDKHLLLDALKKDEKIFRAAYQQFSQAAQENKILA